MDDAERQLWAKDARIVILEALVRVSETAQARRRLLDVVQESTDQAQLYQRIAQEWGFTEIQAVAVADVQLRSLTVERRQQFLEELESVKASRERLRAEP